MNDDLITAILSFILAPPFWGWLGFVRIGFIISAIALSAATIYFLFNTSWLNYAYLEDMSEFLTFKPQGARKILKIWAKLRARLESGSEAEYKLAVLEADSMLDDTLKRLNYKGENLAERLNKLTAATLPSIEDVKEVHEIRNNIVRNPDFVLSLDETRRLLDIYERALTELQVL
ncbi:MAG: hypothetical protein PHW72_02695 [Candidatus Pacebacteria bacterium]|nr:hypothetical protein [Candidatus Paceibacterota bacterium]